MSIKLKIVVFFIITILLGVLFFLTRKTALNTRQEPIPTKQATYRDLMPGKTLRSIVVDFLGKPTNETTVNNSVIQEYPSSDKERNLYVYVNSEEIVYLIIEPVLPSEPFLKGIENFQSPDLVLYGPYSPLGFNLFVNLTRGMAVLANPNTQTIYERWYFPITTKDYFLSAYSTGYSLIPPPTEQE